MHPRQTCSVKNWSPERLRYEKLLLVLIPLIKPKKSREIRDKPILICILCEVKLQVCNWSYGFSDNCGFVILGVDSSIDNDNRVILQMFLILSENFWKDYALNTDTFLVG